MEKVNIDIGYDYSKDFEEYMKKKENAKNPLTCPMCKKSKAEDKYFPYCSAEHWKEAVNKP